MQVSSAAPRVPAMTRRIAVAVGLVAGVSLMLFSQWLRGREYRYFAEGITALGGGVLYLSVYAGWNFYNLFSSGQAFAAMIAATANFHSKRIAR